MLFNSTELKSTLNLNCIYATRSSYAGAQGAFLGLDQVNILIPRALAGKGEVEIGLSVGGRAANKPSVFIK